MLIFSIQVIEVTKKFSLKRYLCKANKIKEYGKNKMFNYR